MTGHISGTSQSFEVYFLPELIVLPEAPSYFYISFNTNTYPTFPTNPASILSYDDYPWQVNSSYFTAWNPYQSLYLPYSETNTLGINRYYYSSSGISLSLYTLKIGTFKLLGLHSLTSGYAVESVEFNPFITYVETNAPKLEYGALANCNNLSTVILTQCSSIGVWALQSCPSLQVLELDYSGVCYAYSQYLASECLPNLSILVPQSLVSDYKAHSRWSSVASRIFPLPY